MPPCIAWQLEKRRHHKALKEARGGEMGDAGMSKVALKKLRKKDVANNAPSPI